MENEKININKNDITDYENRINGILEISKLMNINNDDIKLLLFMAMGDVKDNVTLTDILAKVKLPRIKSKYNKDKLRQYCTILANRMRELDNYGILDLDGKELLRRTKNKEYLTIYGIQILPLVYADIYRILSTNPDYAINTLLGIYASLGQILKYLEVLK